MREVHCNLQIIKTYEVPDNLKAFFKLHSLHQASNSMCISILLV